MPLLRHRRLDRKPPVQGLVERDSRSGSRSRVHFSDDPLGVAASAQKSFLVAELLPARTCACPTVGALPTRMHGRRTRGGFTDSSASRGCGQLCGSHQCPQAHLFLTSRLATEEEPVLGKSRFPHGSHFQRGSDARAPKSRAGSPADVTVPTATACAYVRMCVCAYVRMCVRARPEAPPPPVIGRLAALRRARTGGGEQGVAADGASLADVGGIFTASCIGKGGKGGLPTT